jgi:hypothetical protein
MRQHLRAEHKLDATAIAVEIERESKLGMRPATQTAQQQQLGAAGNWHIADNHRTASASIGTDC